MTKFISVKHQEHQDQGQENKKRAIFTGDKNSSLPQHCIQIDHESDLDDVNIIDRCSQWSKRLLKKRGTHSRTEFH